LGAASLEELLNVEIQSFSRKRQKLSETAGAVTVITAEDIRRSGAAALPEVLRMVPGMQVARIDSGKWAVAARGFNNRYASKMLVMIDGRSIYNSVHGGVYWEQHDLPLDDIERIEVIRGPGATSWGANAVNGVVNIITRRAADTPGVKVSALAGNEESGGVWAARWGGALGRHLHYRLSGKAGRTRAMWPQAPSSWTERNRWNQNRLHFRADWEGGAGHEVSVHGGAAGVEGEHSIQRALMAVTGGRDWRQDRYDGGSLFALTRWRHVAGRWETNLQFYASRESYVESLGRVRMTQVDADFQQRYGVNDRHDLVWGAGYRKSTDRVEAGQLAILPDRERSHLRTAFVQDEYSLRPGRLVLTAGSKFMQNTFSGFDVQPGVRLLWTPRRTWSAWTSVSRAVHLPSRYERGVRAELLVPDLPLRGLILGDPALEPERVRAWEAGLRHQWRKSLSLDVAAFTNQYGGLIDIPLRDPFLSAGRIFVPAVMTNLQRARTQGVETSMSWERSRQWRVMVNHTWFGTRFPGVDGRPQPTFIGASGRDPAHSVQARVSGEAGRSMSWDVFVYRVSSLASYSLGGYTRVDARWAWRARPDWEWSAGVRNGLGGAYVEYPSEHGVRSTARRTVYLKAEWTWGGR